MSSLMNISMKTKRTSEQKIVFLKLTFLKQTTGIKKKKKKMHAIKIFKSNPKKSKLTLNQNAFANVFFFSFNKSLTLGCTLVNYCSI